MHLYNVTSWPISHFWDFPWRHTHLDLVMTLLMTSDTISRWFWRHSRHLKWAMTSGPPGNGAWRHGLVSNKGFNISWWSDLRLTTGSMKEHEFWLKECNDQKISPSICYGRFCWFFADLWTLAKEVDVSNSRMTDPFYAEREQFFNLHGNSLEILQIGIIYSCSHAKTYQLSHTWRF